MARTQVLTAQRDETNDIVATGTAWLLEGGVVKASAVATCGDEPRTYGRLVGEIAKGEFMDDQYRRVSWALFVDGRQVDAAYTREQLLREASGRAEKAAMTMMVHQLILAGKVVI